MCNLNFSPEARDDLIVVKKYISQELCNPQAAVNLTSKIMKKIRGLSTHPEMGSPLSSIVDIQTDYRFLVCSNYLIFYRHEDNTVYVTRILYGRRDYMHILFADLLEDEEK